jgi:hypothetical protein
MQKRRQYTRLPDIELSPELDWKIRAMTRVADRQIEEMQAKARVRALVLNFLRSRPGLFEYVDRFEERWERIKDLGIENLAAGPASRAVREPRVSLWADSLSEAPPDDYSSDLPFVRSSHALGSPQYAHSKVSPIYDSDDPLGMIISVTSWAVHTAKTSKGAIAKGAIAKEASARAMPPPVVKALSSHLAEALSRADQNFPARLGRRQGR